MVVGDACRFAVGRAAAGGGGGGGGGGACGAGFLQAALRARIASKEPNRILACVRFRILILLPPLTIYVSFVGECKYQIKRPTSSGPGPPSLPRHASLGRPV